MTDLTSEDSAALAHAVRKVLRDQYRFDGGRRQALRLPSGERSPIWSRLVELGLASLLVPEVHGGFGGAVTDFQRVQVELGRALVVAPWFQTAIATRALLLGGSAEQRGRHLPALSEGTETIALALLDVDLDPDAVTVASPSSGGWTISGRKLAVAHAASADWLLVAAAVGQGSTGWFLVRTNASGVALDHYRHLDGAWAADVAFEACAAEPLDDGPPAGRLTETLRGWMTAGRCAEAVGLGEAALELTVQYLRTRQQFGQPLGDFQALRHRVADMYIALEQARSAMELAADAVDPDTPAPDASRQLAQARLVSSEAVTWLLQQAIQLHGGMGMTEEMAIGHYYRRMLLSNAESGGTWAALADLCER